MLLYPDVLTVAVFEGDQLKSSAYTPAHAPTLRTLRGQPHEHCHGLNVRMIHPKISLGAQMTSHHVPLNIIIFVCNSNGQKF